jgi:hypothetical protein
MAATKTDCGLAVVEHYFNLLKIGEESCLTEERGFTLVGGGSRAARVVGSAVCPRWNGTVEDSPEQFNRPDCNRGQCVLPYPC